MSLKATELVAAISYVVDLSPNSSHCHSWKVALVARKIAEIVAPQLSDEIFYAGLLHEIGCVDSLDGIREDNVRTFGVPDTGVGLYPAKGASIIAHIPEMRAISYYVRCHHERLDGTGYPSGLVGESIPLGGQILALAEAVTLSGFLNGERGMSEHLNPLVPLAGRAWLSSLWVAFLNSISDTDYYGAVVDPSSIELLMRSVISEAVCPVKDDQKGIESLLESAARMVDNKDPSITGHCMRVATDSKRIAEYMDLNKNLQMEVYQAGLVHDLGKIIVPARILNRPGPISDEEKLVIVRHADIVMRIWNSIMDSDELRRLSNQAFHDHERYDGDGYPDKLKGEDIPVVSRIISVADAYDVMTASDSYRYASPKGALNKIRMEAGKQFDPNIAAAFISVKNGEENQSAA